jgi:hypothetical protein
MAWFDAPRPHRQEAMKALTAVKGRRKRHPPRPFALIDLVPTEPAWTVFETLCQIAGKSSSRRPSLTRPLGPHSPQA